MIILQTVMDDPEIHALIQGTRIQLTALGFTDHSFRHTKLVADKCGEILRTLGYDNRTAELAEIAGYLHDIGNAASRESHEYLGSVLAYHALVRLGMPYDEAIRVMAAIANHDETVGVPVSEITAALILADKADVHKSRVNNPHRDEFDIHDRVNFAVQSSRLEILPELKLARLTLEIDTRISSVMDYFEIFLVRMVMCRGAATKLGLDFSLVINGTQLL